MKPKLKVNLEKQYLYLPMITRANQPTNIFGLMKHLDKKSLLEEVGVVHIEKMKIMKELRKEKVEAMKQLILNHKQIPEKWIMKNDYKEILEESMKDEQVLKYLIYCVDYRYKSKRQLENKSRTKVIIRDKQSKSLSNNTIRKVYDKQRLPKLKLDSSNNNAFLMTALDDKHEKSLPRIQTMSY